MRDVGLSLRGTTAQLHALVKSARCEMRVSGELCAETIGLLRVVVARCEEALLMNGDYTPAPKCTKNAIELLSQYDPLHLARLAKIEEIDRLSGICDRVMDFNDMPSTERLRGLARAVIEYEHLYSCGYDAYVTATAWDILAQAEAGLGQSIDISHYKRAYARHVRELAAEARRTPVHGEEHVSVWARDPDGASLVRLVAAR